MKKILIIVATITVLLIVVFNIISLNNNIYSDNTLADSIISENIVEDNLNININFVQQTDTSIVNNYQDLLNIIYSTLSNGYDNYNFKCSSDYINCKTDIINLLNDTETLNIINNIVNPYCSFDKINISTTRNGDYQIIIKKLYSDKEMKIINTSIDLVLKDIISDDMNDKEKILMIHNYLTNHINYDKRGLTNESPYKTNTAYGAIIEENAICSGYADALNLFLNKLNVPNYKIVSNNHVWNVVFLDNEWKHIDLTWDDFNNVTSYEYFLINTDTLNGYQSLEHNFNKKIYFQF